MDWERFRQQLEQILRADIRLERIGKSEWDNWGRERGLPLMASRERGGELLFPVRLDGDRVEVVAAAPPLMTETERRLVEMLIETLRSGDRLPKWKNGKDAFLAELGEWIEEQIASGELEDREPPAHLAAHPTLYQTRIPFLIFDAHGEGTDGQELKKLLETFFDGEILLVPLGPKERLVLADESLLAPDEDADAEETVEERLASLCAGVHSVILGEGFGECHVTVYYPMVPANSLPMAVARMREALTIGRMQRVDQYVHLPWELYLDQLLSPLSRADRIRFIEQVFKRKEPMLDEETIQTLEAFFELNCNVSETAKRLYIHRNTLLYRLDKFRQESGLDVRNFNQAVHVKIALQLYKVTKRR